jgi:hypothetical protein
VALAATAAAGVFAMIAVTVRVDRYQHSYPVVAAILARSDAPRIRTLGREEPSWVFYTGQTLVPCRGTADAAAFLASGRDAFVITSDDKYGPLEKVLPPGIGIVCDTRYFPKRSRLLVIGHQDGERGTDWRHGRPAGFCKDGAIRNTRAARWLGATTARGPDRSRARPSAAGTE